MEAGGRIPQRVRTAPVDSSRSWPVRDRLGLALCWAAALLLCLIAAGILLFMGVKGIQFLELDLIFSRPQAALSQAGSGGFLDPVLGSAILTLMGVAIATPIGVAVAIWLAEYGTPGPLARAVESAVEVIAGTPSIVLAIFGLLLFTNGAFAILSFEAEGGAVFGRSFIIAATMMSLIALPLIVGATREALQSVPRHVREASFALGKSRFSTVRRVLLPSIRPQVATGVVLGMGRILGDTAIVVILLGATLRFSPTEGFLGGLRGTGSTLTTYVYANSPAGEGNAEQKAYAAAFVLLLFVVFLNFVVVRVIRGRGSVTSWNR